ncbi:MAG TPA: hypothetical protein VNO30_35345 [Kofleriaceae bacterium]|nr:hypothetical protein [Kofleriaceae bacterium]
MMNTRSSQLTLNRARLGVATRALVSGMAAAVLGLAGCAAEPEPGDTTGGAEIIEHSPQSIELIGEFETADGARLTFTAEYERGDGSGDPVVAITELAPASAPSSLERLRRGGATSLEVFLALAPEGAEAPALLRDAHAREAALLGRSAEVRALALGAATTLAPFDSPTCDSYAAFLTSVSTWVAEQTSLSTGYHTLTFEDGGNVVASMCNYDNNLFDSKRAQFCFEVTVQGSEFGLLYCGSEISVPDGYRVNETWLGATTDRVVRAWKQGNASSVTSFIAIGGIVI